MSIDSAGVATTIRQVRVLMQQAIGAAVSIETDRVQSAGHSRTFCSTSSGTRHPKMRHQRFDRERLGV